MPSGSYVTIPILDHGNEAGTHKLPSYQIDAANLGTWLTGWGAYKTALTAIIIGNLKKENVVIYDTLINDNPATNPFAQRELKMLVRYKGDTSGDKLTLTIACPNLVDLTFAPGPEGLSDYLVIEDGGILQAWRDAFVAIARHPENDAETVTVTSVQVVGRNI